MKRIISAVSSVVMVLCFGSFQVLANDYIQDEITSVVTNVSEEKSEPVESVNPEITTVVSDVTYREETIEVTTISEEQVITETTIPKEITNIPDATEEDADDFDELTTEYIPVEDIELTDYNSEMYVKDVQNLSAMVFPQNATEQSVKYFSTNTGVATINKSGKITAVGKGSCQIYVTCGGLSVYYNLIVKVKTEAIEVKNKFVVIKPGQEYALEASVKPSGASQSLKFKSKDETIATVSSDGIIRAESIGNTSITVSNEDSIIVVNVVVSTENISEENEIDFKYTDNKTITSIDSVVEKIRNSDSNIIILEDVDILTCSVLKEIYGTEKEIIVEHDDYAIRIRGQDIFNAQNELNTKLNVSSTENGATVTVVYEGNLPGTISVRLKNCSEKYKYFYLLDNNTNQYKKINSLSNNEFKINSCGEYLLSKKEIRKNEINIVWILAGAGTILAMSVIYIFTKKKYWFW